MLSQIPTMPPDKSIIHGPDESTMGRRDQRNTQEDVTLPGSLQAASSRLGERLSHFESFPQKDVLGSDIDKSSMSCSLRQRQRQLIGPTERDTRWMGHQCALSLLTMLNKGHTPDVRRLRIFFLILCFRLKVTLCKKN